MRTSIGFLVGHNKWDKGAEAYNGMTEYDFNAIVALHAYSYCKQHYHHIDVVVGDRNRGFDEAAKLFKQHGVKHTIELHFNSFARKAYGCEVLIHSDLPEYNYTHHASYIFADLLSDRIEKEYGINQRHGAGVLPVVKGHRGSLNLRSMLKHGFDTALLIEPCFAHMETSQSKKIIDDPKRYAKLLVDFYASQFL